jgi:hypothetical protein
MHLSDHKPVVGIFDLNIMEEEIIKHHRFSSPQKEVYKSRTVNEKNMNLKSSTCQIF